MRLAFAAHMAEVAHVGDWKDHAGLQGRYVPGLKEVHVRGVRLALGDCAFQVRSKQQFLVPNQYGSARSTERNRSAAHCILI